MSCCVRGLISCVLCEQVLKQAPEGDAPVIAVSKPASLEDKASNRYTNGSTQHASNSGRNTNRAPQSNSNSSSNRKDGNGSSSKEKRDLNGMWIKEQLPASPSRDLASPSPIVRVAP
jgi:hypothetical protein